MTGLYKIFNDKWVRQTVWIYSDTHFGDKELAAGLPNRPDDATHIKLINSCVGKADTLILLGDVGDLECAKKLRGYKILIMGNHDAGRTKYEEVFDEVYEGPLMVGPKLLFSHEPIDVPWAFNFHGHDHADRYNGPRAASYNVCSDVIGYKPINLNQLLKIGITSKIETIHRATIDNATKRKKRRGNKI